MVIFKILRPSAIRKLFLFEFVGLDVLDDVLHLLLITRVVRTVVFIALNLAVIRVNDVGRKSVNKNEIL